MPATDREQLLAVTEKEFSKLRHLLEGVDEPLALAKDDDDTSIKDIVAHRAHWIGLFIGWYTAGSAGEEVHFPAPGFKWNELPRYNAELRASQAGIGWDEACELLDEAHSRLWGFIQDHSDQDLYGGPMAGAKNDWTTGRWAEAAGPSHYRSAAKYIRSRLRAVSA